MNIKKIRALRHVRRMNIHHCNKYETVAEHSFYVAMIAREIGIDLKLTNYVIGLIMDKAILHDMEESVTGDINYLVRREISNLSEIEKKAEAEIQRSYIYPEKYYENFDQIIEFADAYELKLYLEEERRSGNTGLLDIERETYSRLFNADFGNRNIQYAWIDKLEKVETKEFPDFISHEGSQ